MSAYLLELFPVSDLKLRAQDVPKNMHNKTLKSKLNVMISINMIQLLKMANYRS